MAGTETTVPQDKSTADSVLDLQPLSLTLNQDTGSAPHSAPNDDSTANEVPSANIPAEVQQHTRTEQTPNPNELSPAIEKAYKNDVLDSSTTSPGERLLQVLTNVRKEMFYDTDDSSIQDFEDVTEKESEDESEEGSEEESAAEESAEESEVESQEASEEESKQAPEENTLQASDRGDSEEDYEAPINTLNWGAQFDWRLTIFDARGAWVRPEYPLPEWIRRRDAWKRERDIIAEVLKEDREEFDRLVKKGAMALREQLEREHMIERLERYEKGARRSAEFWEGKIVAEREMLAEKVLKMKT